MNKLTADKPGPDSFAALRRHVDARHIAAGRLVHHRGEIAGGCWPRLRGFPRRVFDDETVHGVKSNRVQADEIWAFCGAKAKNATPEQKAAGWGDIWTWTALGADSKLLVSFLVGQRGPYNCYEFIKNVASRLANPVQLTTDGLVVHRRHRRRRPRVRH